MTTKISKHIASAISNTKVTMDPYEWMHIENIFPEDYYKLLKSTPLAQAQEMLVDDFNDEDIFKAVIEKFKTAPLNSDIIKSVYAFWQSHGKGYTLKPHEDGTARIFTFTIYLPENDDYPEAGTSVYEVNEETKEYKTVGMIPYVSNSAMLIAPCSKRTWHGVDMLKHDIKRDSVVLVYGNHEWKKGEMHYADWKAGTNINYVI